MILSKARTSVSSHGDRSKLHSSSQSKRASVPDLLRLLEARDYTGAITLLQFKRLEDAGDRKLMEWLAYAHFHHGEHDKALLLYKELLEMPDTDPMYHTYAAACLFYMADYNEAHEAALQGPECPLQIRIQFQIAHRQNDETKLLECHAKLGESMEDQLCLASIHYLRTHYQESTDIYKRILLENRDWLALNVYIALCYCNLDYYDVSLEVLDEYLQVHPESALAVNVKACNNYKLFSGKAAEADLKALEETLKGPTENELVKHNHVVFRSGENALQALPPLLGILPEAKLNLIIYYLQNSELQEAYNMVKELEPSTPQEYVVKAVSYASLGQEIENAEMLKQAQHYFQLVGSSASECDTIPGRQCMASCFFLLKQFDDALIYLKSIKAYSEAQDEFNWNYGIAKAAVGAYQEAEQALLLVSNEHYQSDYYYQAWLCRCFIMAGKASLAWDHNVQIEASEESFSLLLLIANECYKTGQYLYAAKAFDGLERMDESPEYWEGKRGACIGVFQMVISGKEPKESLIVVLELLRNTNNSQVCMH
ncbi:unnamed protein product [Sphagnum tenellum]